MTRERNSLLNIDEIWNCEDAFQFRCPKLWESLDLTEDEDVRYCRECEQKVFLCSTPEEFVRLGNAGHCVAVPKDISPSGLQETMLGRASLETIRSIRERKNRIEEWWSTAIVNEPEFSTEAFHAIVKTIESRQTPLRSLSPEYRQYLTEYADALRKGPDAFYLFLRVRPSGKRENEQSLFKRLAFHFPMTFREFNELVKRLDESDPC